MTLPVDGPGGGVDGGVEGGGDDGGATTTGVGAWSKLAIAEVLSKFTADREPPGEGAEPLPVEAAGLAVAMLAKGDGVGDLGGAAAAAVEVAPAKRLVVDCDTGAVALLESAVVRVTCPAAAIDVSRAARVADTLVGRVASFRCCFTGALVGGAEVFGSSVCGARRGG